MDGGSHPHYNKSVRFFDKSMTNHVYDMLIFIAMNEFILIYSLCEKWFLLSVSAACISDVYAGAEMVMPAGSTVVWVCDPHRVKLTPTKKAVPDRPAVPPYPLLL